MKIIYILLCCCLTAPLFGQTEDDLIMVEVSPNENRVMYKLTKLYDALEAKDYDAARKYIVVPDSLTKEELDKELASMLENGKITRNGIALLQKESSLDVAESQHGDYAIKKINNAGLSSNNCYTLYIRHSRVKCMFHWDGRTERFFCLENIRGDDE